MTAMFPRLTYYFSVIFCSWVNSRRHFFISKIKAVFGGLKETVKFLHLLAAKLNTKNPFLPDELSITYNFIMSI